jgi:hypothetical protein
MIELREESRRIVGWASLIGQETLEEFHPRREARELPGRHEIAVQKRGVEVQPEIKENRDEEECRESGHAGMRRVDASQKLRDCS